MCNQSTESLNFILYFYRHFLIIIHNPTKLKILTSQEIKQKKRKTKHSKHLPSRRTCPLASSSHRRQFPRGKRLWGFLFSNFVEKHFSKSIFRSRFRCLGVGEGCKIRDVCEVDQTEKWQAVCILVNFYLSFMSYKYFSKFN